ncbi:MAG: outer membrane beta-barrel protein [Terrimonas sp.]|nr:outer membrane beta-barrel protein [Terrimonas sp.]
MKKFLIVLLLFCSISAYPQFFSLGLKGGANISNFSGGNFGDLKNKAIIAFHVGTYLNFKLGAVSLVPEILISTQGAKLDSATGSDTWKVTYLSVPFMVKYRTSGGFYAELGPQVSFKLNEDIGNQTINAFAKNLDLSAAAGIGLQAKSGLGIGIRYLAGLSKVGDFTGNNINPDFKNSLLQVSLMIGLNSGK